MNEDVENSSEQRDVAALPNWRPLGPTERRVVGVLIEKAKTTPDAYPLTLNAITTGCNQKSNRHPQLDLDSDDVLLALDELRNLGAVVEVQSAGRVPKYRHQMYEWLGVDKKELAVIAELLLRGRQTLGELRARAARMEAIADISQLKPLCQSLMQRNLMVALTPEGRGQIVDHGLYPDHERPAPIAASQSAGSQAAVPPSAEASGPAAASRDARTPAAAPPADDIARLEAALRNIEQRLQALEDRWEDG